ncbi:MAG TPA: DNA recombination/repair protein RecA, partial [Phycisphaerales bacterium]|nr:DNA recombination/repair protein RecA [Phycisphaerales bacterium]
AENIVKKSGAWFSYGDVRLGQGRENSKLFLREHEDLFTEIRNRILVAKGLLETAGDADATASQAQPEEEVAAG